MAIEELKWGDAAHKWIPPGCLYTSGPGSYKIPSMNDVPFKFSVSLLKVYFSLFLCYWMVQISLPCSFMVLLAFIISVFLNVIRDWIMSVISI